MPSSHKPTPKSDQAETGQTVSRAIATGRPSGSSVQHSSQPSFNPRSGKDIQKRLTSNHFTGVIYNALVVLIGTMREVHADYAVDESDNKNLIHGGIDMNIGRTDVDTGPSKLGELLGSVDLGP